MATPARARALAASTAVRRGALALVDQGVVSGTSFLTALIIGRTTTPAELGRYTVALTVVLLLVEVQNSLIATPYTVARPRLAGQRLAEHAGDVTLLQVAMGLLAAAFLLAAATLLPGESGGLAAMVAAGMLPLLFREHLRRLSFAGFELRSVLRLDLLVAGVQLAGIVALALTDRLSASSAFAVMGVAAAVGGVGWGLAWRVPMRLSAPGAARALPEMWQAGRWVLASGVAWALGLYAYPWLLAVVRGSGAAGVWAAGMGLASLANPALLGLGNYLAPETAHVFAADGAGRLGAMVRRTCGILTLLMMPLLAAAAVFGERLVALVYGPQYAATGALVLLLSLHLWMTALAFPVSRAFFALERADVELRANLVGLAVLAAAGYWLVAALGAQGAALGLVLGGAAANAARALWLTRLLRMRRS